MTFEEAALFFVRVADDLPGILDEAAEQGLWAVAAVLEPDTPVVTGDMRRGYRVYKEGRQWLLADTQYYAPYVIEGTRRNRPNPRLGPDLDRAERQMGAALDFTVQRRFGDWR